MNKFKFEKLIIWQRAMDFGEIIYQVSMAFPDKEKFNVSSQICRASDSMALNISEGSIGQSNLEQKSLLDILCVLWLKLQPVYLKQKEETISLKQNLPNYMMNHSI